MSGKSLKIVKNEQPVRLWVHPEGAVVGTLFLRPQDADDQAESPADVLNTEQPFLVLRRTKPDEIRFYNRNAIVRVEYEETPPTDDEMVRTMQCVIHMMDGSVIDGRINESLPPEHARLYDYLNQGKNRFLKLFTSSNEACLVNKSYVIQVTTQTD